MASSPVRIGEILAGKYRIERVLGEGGMGVVVAAHHLELDQPVAIKFLLEGLADKEEGAERFRREARAAAKIHSDHVVRVLDVGIMADGVRYMVMEYLEGRDLAQELAETGALPVGVACGLILEVIDAVGHAHAVGIVHRDLKPANIFLVNRADGSRRIKVLDFGISKSVGVEQLSLTKTSAWIGSPLYMAPEQMQSARDVDTRADIWSIGAILYELLCGSPPYEAESLPQLCNLLITTDAPSIQERNADVPADLAQAVMNCLVRDETKRSANVGDLARVVARYATTITGSGISRVYTENSFLSSVPSPAASVAALSGRLGSDSGATVLASSGERGEFVDVTLESESTDTSAAWGATDHGLRNKSSLKIWAAAAILVLGAAGFVLFGGGLSNSGDPREFTVDTEQESGATSPPSAAEGLVPEPIAPAARPVSGDQQETKPPDGASEKGAEPALVTAQSAATLPTPSPDKVTPSKKTWHRPSVKPQARAPQPAPEPAPTPAPAATMPSDEFSDFGGRR